jgi:hypothetical protein
MVFTFARLTPGRRTKATGKPEGPRTVAGIRSSRSIRSFNFDRIVVQLSHDGVDQDTQVGDADGIGLQSLNVQPRQPQSSAQVFNFRHDKDLASGRLEPGRNDRIVDTFGIKFEGNIVRPSAHEIDTPLAYSFQGD